MHLKMPFLMPYTFQTEGDKKIQIGFFNFSDFSSDDMDKLCSTVLTTLSKREMLVISISDIDNIFSFSDLEKLSRFHLFIQWTSRKQTALSNQFYN